MSKLSKLNILLFGKILSLYPEVLEFIREKLSPYSKQACLDCLIKVVFSSIHYKAIISGSSVSYSENMRYLYDFDPDIVKS